MTPEDILRFDRMVPRYTSLPKAAMGGAGEGGPRGDGLEDFADALATLAPLEASGAVHRRGAHIRVSPQARLLPRVVCAAFDCRLSAADQTTPRHAAAV
jgi:hypothetical protein